MRETAEEKLLQDMYDATPAKPKLWKKIVLGGLLFLLLATVLYKIFGERIIWERRHAIPVVQASPSPLPKTGTFVDDLFGTILYYHENTLYEIQTPGRNVKKVVGVDEKQQAKTLQFAPVWSADGDFVVVPTSSKEATIIAYDKGTYVSTLQFSKEMTDPTKVLLTFSPLNYVVSASFLGSDRRDDLYFYTGSTGKQIGAYSNCSGKGAWLSEEGYVTTCWLGDQESVVVIRFTEESSFMVTVARSTKSLTYEVLPVTGTKQAMVVRNKKELGVLTMDGKFVPFTTAEKKNVPSIEILRDPPGELRKKIQTTTKLENVIDVSVSSDNNWMAFSSNGDLYVVDISLKEKPFNLGKGSSPKVRPY